MYNTLEAKYLTPYRICILKKNTTKRIGWASRIALLCATFLALSGCAKVPLYSDVAEKEANEMMAILINRGIEVEKSAGKEEYTWIVQVDADNVAESIEVLNKYGYPKDRFQGVGKQFQKSGLVSSPSEERIRFMDALSQDLAETLTNIDGVLNARVHIVLAENNPLKEALHPSSAAVFIKYRRGSGVESLAPQIKKMVTNSIEGLEYEKVSLAFFPSDLNEIIAYSVGQNEMVVQEESDMMRTYIIYGMIAFMLLIVLAAGGYWYWSNQKPLPPVEGE